MNTSQALLTSCWNYLRLSNKLQNPSNLQVLDLDETLVHTELRDECTPEAWFKMMIGGQMKFVCVGKRPHLDHFLERCAALYEVVVFTASLKHYADAVIDRIDPQRYFQPPSPLLAAVQSHTWVHELHWRQFLPHHDCFASLLYNHRALPVWFFIVILIYVASGCTDGTTTMKHGISIQDLTLGLLISVWSIDSKLSSQPFLPDVHGLTYICFHSWLIQAMNCCHVPPAAILGGVLDLKVLLQEVCAAPAVQRLMPSDVRQLHEGPFCTWQRPVTDHHCR